MKWPAALIACAVALALWLSAATSLAPDLPYETTLDDHRLSVLMQIRQGPPTYNFELASHTTDLPLYSLALPHVLSDSAPRLQTVGPQPDPSAYRQELIKQSPPLLLRWKGMILAAASWIGSSFWLTTTSLSLRILAGALTAGWAILLLSWLLHVPAATLTPYWAALALPLSAWVLMKNWRPRLSTGNVATLLLALYILQPIIRWFLTGQLEGHDGRVMWFYRYKFLHFFPFDPELIRSSMHISAEKDYPWVLAGALGLANWGRGWIDAAGWHENSAFGALLVLHCALASTLLRYSGLRSYGLLALAALYGAFHHFATNGYMDLLWIPAFCLRLQGWLAAGNREHRVEAAILLCFASSLKYEGLVLTGWALLLTRQWHALPVVLPSLGTKLYLALTGVRDQYAGGKAFFHFTAYEALKRFESAHRFIVKRIFLQHPAYLVPCLACLLMLGSKRWRSLLWRFYVLIFPIIMVYTLTPHDQDWQMETSAYRVFLLLPAWFAVSALSMTKVKHATE